MNHLVKPVGRCLTTAVVTSAMLDVYAVPALTSPPPAAPQAGLEEPSMSTTSSMPTAGVTRTHTDRAISAGTIAPPERSPANPQSLHAAPLAAPTGVKPTSPVAAPLTQLPQTTGEVPLPDSVPSANPVPVNAPVAATSAGGPAKPNSAPVVPPVSQPTATPAEPSRATTANDSQSPEMSRLAQARQQVAQTLHQLVQADRTEREAQLQRNLIAAIQAYVQAGNFDQARLLAQNPALPLPLQTDLLAQIEAIAQGMSPADAGMEIAEVPSAPTATAPTPVSAATPSTTHWTPVYANPMASNQCLLPTTTASTVTAQPTTTDLPKVVVPANVTASSAKPVNAISFSPFTSSGPTSIAVANKAVKKAAPLNTTASNPSLSSTEKPAVDKQLDISLNHLVKSTVTDWLDKAGVSAPLTLPPSLETAVGWWLDLDQTSTLTWNLGDRMPAVDYQTTLPLMDAAQPLFASELADSPLVLELKNKATSKLDGASAVISRATTQLASEKAVSGLPETIPVVNLTPIAVGNCNGFSYGNFDLGQTVTTAIATQLSRLGMQFPLPIPAALTSAFGWRIHPISGDRRFHAGIDLGAPMGTPVIAATSGQVVTAEYMGGYGLAVIIENDQTSHRNLYGHLSGIAVQSGTWVEQGSVIGWVGSTGNSTGPHLHFESQLRTTSGWTAVNPLAAGAIETAAR